MEQPTGEVARGLRALTTGGALQRGPQETLVPRFVKGWLNLIDPLNQILWEKDSEDENWSLSTSSVYPIVTHRLPVQQGHALMTRA